MRMFSSAKYALGVAAAAAILAGCSSSGSQLSPAVGGGQSFGANAQHGQPLSLVPSSFLHRDPRVQSILNRDVAAPDKTKKAGTYVGEFFGTTILGYPSSNPKNGAPVCTISGVSAVNSLGADDKGNVIDPDGGTRTIIVFPPNCGASLGSTSDSYGQPSDASSANAATGKILVGNILDTSQTYGSASICTLKGGCTVNLVSPTVTGYVAGVAMDKKGKNCWETSENSSFTTATMTYFKGCKGTGVAATGFMNKSYGGLDLDTKGDLLSIDFQNNTLYVYKGCNPACKMVGTAQTLHGSTLFGKLNDKATDFQAVEYIAGTVDDYTYKSGKLTYKYSYSNGLSASLQPEGIAQAPRSDE